MRSFQTPALKLVVGILFLATFISCKKDSGDDGPGNGKKITDVVPAEYIQTVTDHGMPVYEGFTPPDIQGKFSVNPLQFDYNNYSAPGTGLQPGYIIGNIEALFSSQSDNQDINVDFVGTFINGVKIKSPFITGSGNNFTVCFQVDMFGGPDALFVFPFAYLISGTVEGETIKNVKIANVGLGEANDLGYKVFGNVTLYSDKDGVSEQVVD